jgi:hypothetical protein
MRLAQILDLLAEDRQLNVYAGELQVRPPDAPTTDGSGPSQRLRGSSPNGCQDVYRKEEHEIGSTAPNLAETRVTQRPRIFRSASDVDDEDPPGGPHDTRDFLKRLHAFSASCDVVDRQARHDDVE